MLYACYRGAWWCKRAWCLPHAVVVEIRCTYVLMWPRPCVGAFTVSDRRHECVWLLPHVMCTGYLPMVIQCSILRLVQDACRTEWVRSIRQKHAVYGIGTSIVVSDLSMLHYLTFCVCIIWWHSSGTSVFAHFASSCNDATLTYYGVNGNIWGLWM